MGTGFCFHRKKEYGKYFVGGVQKSAYAMQYAKDILLPLFMK